MSDKNPFHRISSGMAKGSIANFASRITGLIRDILFAHYWGTSNALGRFFFAFTIPNLFRRILGEGALVEAFVPLFTEKLSQLGKRKAFLYAGNVLSVTSIILVLIIVLGILLCEGLKQLFPHLAATQTTTLIQFLLPYTYFVCIIGVLSGILNSCNYFGIPALNPIILNCSLIFGLVFVCPKLGPSDMEKIYGLIFVVLVSGVLQLLLLVPLLKR